MRDAVVIGAGLAGLVAAARLLEQGMSVTLVSKGLGGLQLGQGTVDYLGYAPEYVEDPRAAIDGIDDESHPYAPFSADDVDQATAWIRRVVGEDLLVGDGRSNYRLPTAVGALRPTALPQPSMVAGQPRGKSIVLVGLDRLKDFYPDLVAENLRRQANPDGSPIRARAVHVDVMVRDGEVDSSGLQFARALDDPAKRAELCRLVAPLLREDEVVGFPAVLGLADHDAWRDVAARLGHEVFEVPLQPPSVPGMRLNERLTRLVKSGMRGIDAIRSVPGETGVVASRARLILGAHVTGFEAEGGRIASVTVASAGRPRTIEARQFVLATGGFESGGLAMDSYGAVSETLVGLPLHGVVAELVHGDYWGEQPVFKVGVRVDGEMRPVDDTGDVVYSNLRAAGGVIGGSIRWREKSGDGIALLTALRAADSIVGAHTSASTVGSST
ncbi:glycerol-3-phosphate dehydrogenase subunit GlpB [Tessaracoccus caeni]|uniref:glycerol-3-phosphate dehydrogenase subunit GlpB n=1 Tax=Tessaracoccus caeni TaxID=3031239 RepID=UPI0023DB0C75|nr:glycerol-3-phosphate dehydrogenase subunit GlpB [Tessaracoccus caeni]MDF1486889.1 glycerol-3-phosphate dehydrogenase subunit GlpB [Tessaracoccus caeni]